ncbi:MMPL family transporter [Planococcus sp. ISL-109]|uniref:MMPL family transporter n=1 Tax=Planococcus sp. ISL-109 TaxID=2819166 RepID=UPI001BEA82AE|nr:MMPL family transporter [Planococcus sp. ISL-109]MBT2581362.1 MMPL family transporter [Planococcus sp. ISL-109]
MQTILKLKWPITIGLVILTVALFLLAPNLTEQAEEAGSFQLSEEVDSQRASSILEAADVSGQTISLVIQLDSELGEEAQQQITGMREEIEALGDPVTTVLDPFESAELEEQLVSQDRQTVLLPVSVEGSDEEVEALAGEIRETIVPEGLTVYLTGEAIINQDVNTSAQEGLKKTEIITVILIFGLLLAVFRSFVTPIIPLVAVGLSYLLSQSLVAFFIDWFGFPVSNYTQIFLVAILFGLGTDYCILLLSRYKEELTEGKEVQEAILNTYRTAGKTLFISGFSGLIAFAAIGFAEFPIFKSAVAVAVGIGVLLVVLFTVMPFFMAVLKDKLFWPSKKSASHKDSKLWVWIGKLSVNRPLWSMLLVALITVPLLFSYNNDLSFNTVDEISSDYESVKGLDAIEEAFGAGNTMPVQVVIKAQESLTAEETIPYLDALAQDMEKVEGVDMVRAITRPTGSVIEEFFVDHQLGLIAEGLEEANVGVDEVQSGLVEIETNLAAISEQAGGDGLREAAAGLAQVNGQLAQISGGLQQTGNIEQTIGALTQVNAGLTEIEEGLGSGATQYDELASGLVTLSEGVGASAEGLTEINDGLTEIAETLTGISDSEAVRGTGIYLPPGTLEEEEFEQLLDQFSFADGEGMLMEVVLEENPYSPEAINIVTDLKEAAARSINGTPLEDVEIAYGGVPSINSDLNDISASDFTRTVSIMLVSLFVVLAVLLRSFIMPLFMIASLLLTYYSSIAITELIFVNALGYDGITWAVPFFGFVMLVSLGIDYSIFLLDRYREEALTAADFTQAMRRSMAKMGTVIITAAILLAGTFGAMLPSGVLSLMQIATIVITGLLLYGLIVLPLLVPAITVSFAGGAWWPFGLKKKK